MTDLNQLSAWQYHLPPELIASRPAAQRDASRLMVVERSTGTIRHSQIRDLPDILSSGDLLVFNNTQVLPARLFGYRTATGGKWEGLFVEAKSDGVWVLLGETRGRLQPGETLTIIPAESVRTISAEAGESDASGNLKNRFSSGERSLEVTLMEKQEDGSWLVSVRDDRSPFEILEEFGSLPLPPYMGRKLADADDRQRYQTHFASVPGAVAAPTAGLHFTPELLSDCRSRSISTTEVTLHVGIGTFRPVSVDRLSEHQMHYEWCQLPAQACEMVASAGAGSGRVIAVGTTSVRTLESVAVFQPQQRAKKLQPWQGQTNLFIQPGFQFQIIDGLLTNFHLPGSTLIVLVAALAGYELIMEAYQKAIENRYRFYSYGDAMLIV